MDFPGLFEELANDDSDRQRTARKAVALAGTRVRHRFAKFLSEAGSPQERDARLSLVEDDLAQTIEAACAECGHDDVDGVKTAIFAGLEPVASVKTASHESARRPRMCPYHKEVTDIALAAGDPTAGFNAMAQHAWTGNHCQGGDYEGAKCNFKPDMVTQSYWDNKAEQAEHRRVEREEAQRLQEAQPIAPEPEWDQLDELHGEDDTNYSDEPSAIGEGAEPEFQTQELMPMAASTKEAEALKTVDVTQGGEGPTPKMDKRKWTVDNVTPLETEGEGSPHPTKRVDIAERVDYSNEDPLEGSHAVTEHQDVTKKAPTQHGQGGSWSTNKGVNPVSSRVARGDEVFFHSGVLSPLNKIEQRFPGITINGQPVFPDGPLEDYSAHPLYMQKQQGVLGHPDPAIDPLLRHMGETDGAGLGGDPNSYLKAIAKALKAEGRWPAAPGQVQGSVQKHSPGKQHMPGVSPKRNRQYEHIKERCLADGGSEEECKELAARTVNKQRSEHGETKSHTGANEDWFRYKNEGGPYYAPDRELNADLCPQCEEADMDYDESTGEHHCRNCDYVEHAPEVNRLESAVDVEKNPLRDFIPEEQVQEAVAEYEEA